MSISSSASHASSPARGVAATLHVADLARRAEVTPATVRYYARIGLLNPRRDDHNGYRRFSAEDLHRLAFVRKAQTLGLTIADIRAILEQIEDGLPVCTLVVELVRNRLDEIRRQRAELEATEARIANALCRWAAASGARSSAGEFCPLIEELEIPEEAPGPDARVM